MNIAGLLEHVDHRCGRHGKDVPADTALALVAEIRRLAKYEERAMALEKAIHEFLPTMRLVRTGSVKTNIKLQALSLLMIGTIMDQAGLDEFEAQLIAAQSQNMLTMVEVAEATKKAREELERRTQPKEESKA